MYRPLPDYLTIRPSRIDGLGLFATENIGEGVDLGMSHIIVDGNYIRTPLGGFYNHSPSPNIERRQVSPTQWNLFTLRKIEKNEELLAHYSLYQVVEKEKQIS